ncbi:hypothetical protein C2845_PM13G24490 [Panicum miliaceum]|uniref:DUF7769 domain-containing protein n=1 Tax=Panicum miliaceum TaxID=4540 RepID=A0A3L6RHJ9_PANMI|nr:hypothetical protein C2845_PM13G24490 [Panicum miliaceum]
MAATLLLDLNAAPPEELDGEIIPGGMAAADALTWNEGNAQEAADVDMEMSVFLDLNTTTESVDEMIPGGSESADTASNAMAQDEEGIPPAQAAGVQQLEMRLNKWLTDAQRYAAYTALHAKSRDEKLPKNATKEVATFFQAHVRVIQKIWKRAREQIALGQEVDVSNKRTGDVSSDKYHEGFVTDTPKNDSRRLQKNYTLQTCMYIVAIEKFTCISSYSPDVFLTQNRLIG